MGALAPGVRRPRRTFTAHDPRWLHIRATRNSGRGTDSASRAARSRHVRPCRGMAREQKSPLVTSFLALIETCDPGTTLAGFRDRALLLVGYMGAFGSRSSSRSTSTIWRTDQKASPST